MNASWLNNKGLGQMGLYVTSLLGKQTMLSFVLARIVGGSNDVWVQN
jgi:hypothetical protein